MSLLLLRGARLTPSIEPADVLALPGPVPPVIDVEGEDHRRQLEELEARLATALSANTELLQSIADASDEANVFVTLADERTAKADLRAKQAESHAADADAARAHMERSRDDLAQRLDVLRSSAVRLADARAERDDVKERLARETRRADEAARQCTADAAQHRRALDALAQEKIAVEQDRDAARDTGAAQTVRAVAAETRAADADQQLQATSARVQELERALRPLLDAATQVQVLLGTSPMAPNNSRHTK
jgi:chromosome segregation ATPase